MKKFEFSLSHMRDYKERILDEELGRLQTLKGEQNRLEQHIDDLKREFQAISRRMTIAQEKGTTVMEVRGYSVQLDNLRRHLKDLNSSLKQVVKKVAEQTKVVVAANQEVSKLDKLQDKQYEAYRRQAAKAEELRVEELVVLGLSRQSLG